MEAILKRFEIQETKECVESILRQLNDSKNIIDLITTKLELQELHDRLNYREGSLRDLMTIEKILESVDLLVR